MDDRAMNSSGDIEALAVLSEELGEAQQIIGKILRHGIDLFNPTTPDLATNMTLLYRECGDVLAAIGLVGRRGLLGDFPNDVLAEMQGKFQRLPRWLHDTANIRHAQELAAEPWRRS